MMALLVGEPKGRLVGVEQVLVVFAALSCDTEIAIGSSLALLYLE